MFYSTTPKPAATTQAEENPEKKQQNNNNNNTTEDAKAKTQASTTGGPTIKISEMQDSEFKKTSNKRKIWLIIGTVVIVVAAMEITYNMCKFFFYKACCSQTFNCVVLCVYYFFVC